MADIAIFVSSMANVNGLLRVDGQAFAIGSDNPINWQTEVEFDDLASTINTAIKNAAVAAAAEAEITVGALDKKTLFAGAVGL